MKFSDVIKTLCVCGCVFGSICEDTRGMEDYRHLTLENRVLKCSDMWNLPYGRYTTQIDISNCTLSNGFICGLLGLFNFDNVYDSSDTLKIRLRECSMDNETREYIVDWLEDVCQGYGCILQELELRDCGFSKEQKDHLLQDITIANIIKV